VAFAAALQRQVLRPLLGPRRRHDLTTRLATRTSREAKGYMQLFQAHLSGIGPWPHGDVVRQQGLATLPKRPDDYPDNDSEDDPTTVS
jgi:hypothetical protein